MLHSRSWLRQASFAPEKAGYELYLTQTIRNATLIRTKGGSTAVDLFKSRGADALAGLKPDLLNSLEQMPDARMLEGTFMTGRFQERSATDY